MSSSVTDDDEGSLRPRLSPPLQNTSSPRDHEPVEAGVEELRKWHHERAERRLRGEYESQIKRLVEVVGNNIEQPVRIGAVRVDGAIRTRNSFLESVIRPHFFSPTTSTGVPSTTLEDVLKSTRRISTVLEDSQIFKTIEASLERSCAALGDANDVDLVFKCREKGRYFLRTATDIGNQEGTASATGRITNVFGGAETLEGNVSFGTKTRHAFQLRLEAPIVTLDPSLHTRGEVSAFATERDYTTFASCMEDVHGVKLALRTPWHGSHEIAYELTSRNIGRPTDSASLSIREAAGHSFKSALQHTYLQDTRDDTMFGTRGSYTKVSHEVAGLGGDVAHFKSESAFQTSRQVAQGLSLSASSHMGLIYPLAMFASRPRTSPTMFSDRFQVGGPLSIRMFQQNGLGPQDGGDAVGGDMYWSAGLSVLSDIPRKPTWPVKLHGFINAGRLDAFDRSKPLDLIGAVKRSLARPSISAGVGLIYRFDPIRVEVNFGVPLVTSASDKGRRGIQVGMGLEFL